MSLFVFSVVFFLYQNAILSGLYASEGEIRVDTSLP